MAYIEQILSVIERFSPPHYSELWQRADGSYDNSGLILGGSGEAEKVLLCLDLGEAVLDEAEAVGAGMILTHHPAIYRGVRQLNDRSAAGRLLQRAVRMGLTVYSAHLSLDAAPEGLNAWFARACGLSQARPVRELEDGGYLYLGEIDPIPAEDYAGRLSRAFGCAVRRSAVAGKVHRIAVLNGGGGSLEFLQMCREMGADGYVSGDFAHHVFLEAARENLAVFEVDHYHAEHSFMDFWAERLNALARESGVKVGFFKSQNEGCPHLLCGSERR